MAVDDLRTSTEQWETDSRRFADGRAKSSLPRTKASRCVVGRGGRRVRCAASSEANVNEGGSATRRSSSRPRWQASGSPRRRWRRGGGPARVMEPGTDGGASAPPRRCARWRRGSRSRKRGATVRARRIQAHSAAKESWRSRGRRRGNSARCSSACSGFAASSRVVISVIEFWNAAVMFGSRWAPGAKSAICNAGARA